MKNILIVSLLLVGLNTVAQDYLGLSQSNYAGALGIDYNPANVADNRMEMDLSINGSLSFTNNYVYMNTQSMPNGWIASFNDTTNSLNVNWRNDPDFGKFIAADSASYYQSQYRGNFFVTEPGKLANSSYRGILSENIDLLNLMVTLNKKSGIGFQIKHRTIVNVDHISQELVTLGVKELDYSTLWNLDLDDQLMNISMNSWMEYNFNYAHTIKDDGEHFFKAGGKIKALKGIGSFYLFADNIEYNFLNDSVANTLNGNFSYGYSQNIAKAIETPDLNNDGLYNGDDLASVPIFSSNWGLGIDIGGVYEWRPDWEEYKYDMDGETNLWRRDQNKYKLRASFAINDIGSMKYNKAEASRDFTTNLSNFDMGPFTTVQGLISLDSVVTNLVEDDPGVSYTSNQAKSFYRMNLPTHINMDVDYHIWKDFYVNARCFIGFQRNKAEAKVKLPSSFSITPRFDHKIFGVSVPISMSGLYGLRAGIALRAGPVFFGFADMKPIFAPGKNKEIRGGNIYAGVRLWVFNHHPKDKDNDLVSNHHDKCKDVPGIWEFYGCPDTDKDGIEDSKDACPKDSGLVEFNGCPDRDGDKIIDNEDACPEIAGLAAFKGCPDTDGDSIIDKDDLCPKVPGLLAFSGCPDTDGDGLSDNEDLCPNDAGPKANEGCPDTDKDGLFDYLDQCPEVSGPEENKGCPWPDTDKDGLLDKDDDCPNNAGPKSNKGCPYKDTDGDGVMDKDDDCVNTPGAKSNNGCPLIQEEEQEIINTAFEALEFQSGKDIIKEVSNASLEELAMLLLRKSEWKLIIAGHTDNVGNDKTNLILSKKRSTAIAVFLEHRGVSMDRLIIQYFGEEKPLESNDTKEGRQKNRRVEMTVLFE
jgi:outer membrane protein OmpA-like peptidoglycan-associated protein